PLRFSAKATRFSRTVRLGKICRPSGTSATPRRAMRSGDMRSVRAPRKEMLPLNGLVRPMIERTVVVLPMPFRPRSVTTSPWFICISIPKSTWLAPYAVSSFSTLSRDFVSEVGATHFRIRPDLFRRVGGDHPPVDHHRDAVGEAEHRVHVVLDEQHRDAGADALDQLDHAPRLLRAHAGHRLVEQHQLRLRREREADLERALFAVRQRGCR